jgi:hypothetical protein
MIDNLACVRTQLRGVAHGMQATRLHVQHESEAS